MPNEFLPVSDCRGKRAEWIAAQDARGFLFLNASLSRACKWNAALPVMGGHKRELFWDSVLFSNHLRPKGQREMEIKILTL